MTDVKKYQVEMTEREMQFVANALSGFYRVCTREGLTVDFSQTTALLNVLERFKLILNAPMEDKSSSSAVAVQSSADLIMASTAEGVGDPDKTN